MARKSPVNKMRASRAKRVAIGHRQITVMLGPIAAERLEAWEAKGESITGIVNWLLANSKPPR